MYLEEVVAGLVQKVEQRFYGIYRAVVKDNADPEKMGRLKVVIPDVMGKEIAVWASPCFPYGGAPDQAFLFIPAKGAGVWVAFEGGSIDYPVWVGASCYKPKGKSELPAPGDAEGKPQDGARGSPTCKIIRSKAGHTVQLEDKDGEEMVSIVEAKNSHVITMNKDGIKIKDGAHNHEIILDNSGITISDGKGSHKITMESGGVTINSSGQVKIGGNAGEQLVLGTTLNTLLTQFITALNTHMHTGNLGAPTPIIAPLQLDISTALSQKNFVE